MDIKDNGSMRMTESPITNWS